MTVAFWKCHICAEDFDAPAGGICSRCKKPTCFVHLKLANYKEKDGQAKVEQIVCDQCLKPGEPFIKFEQRFLSKSSWRRIFG